MATYQSKAEAVAAIQAHPLCADYMETPGSFVVFYPDTYRIPGGASLPRGMDELATLNMLYDRLEQFWQAQRLQVSAQ